MFGIAQCADLKQRVIVSILAEGADGFNMGEFKPDNQRLKQEGMLTCGTACCIAGHIVAASRGIEGLRKTPYHMVSIVARAAWGEAYGTEEARRLRFNAETWGRLSKVTPEEAIAHLNGQAPVFHEYTAD